MKSSMNRKLASWCVIACLSVLLAACSGSKSSITAEQAAIEYDLLYSMPENPIDFEQVVRPVLEQRCIVCHGCYDAPCQLKLTSAEGIRRGSSEQQVYDGARIIAAEPTRLFIDAVTTEQWRQKGFHAVLNGSDNNPARNLEDSVLYRMLRLKQLHPQARTGMLTDKFDISLGRTQSCPTLDTFDDYAARHPEGGMPFAMPNLGRTEYETLVHWLAQGAPMPEDSMPSKTALPQLERWEQFLNGDSNREQLVSRYLYEHLFQAHLHFEGTDDREFYTLVRSTTAPGTPVEIIATRRPYGSPPGRAYYRIVRHQGSIVAKDHLVYELSDGRMQRYRELFYQPDYVVDTLPSYDNAVASNPIKTFADLPVKSRYRFLLDDARFFIEGFIKGPVCRGQIALNVIEDQFWVMFVDPDAPTAAMNPEFLNSMADYLASPAELEDTLRLLSASVHYKELLKNYTQARIEAAQKLEPVTLDAAMKYIWDGDGDNPNAALTIFRHYDSASVSNGWVGDYPETAWLIDYSVLERIHYLLVAGYDVYGNLGHQLNTRLYMDFLRMEGEDKFLALLPADRRKQIHDSWYTGIRESERDEDELASWINLELVTGYVTDDPKRELLQHVERYLGPLAGDGDYINRCTTDACRPDVNKAVLRVETALQKVSRMDGIIVKYLPDAAFLRVRMGGDAEHDLAFTLISNKAYTNVTSMFAEVKLDDRRDYANDTQTVVPWLEGAYPSFFYVVDLDEIEAFAVFYNAIQNRDMYEQFVARYGLRRTDERFWETSDWFNAQFAREQPRLSGIFDLNRYQNR